MKHLQTFACAAATAFLSAGAGFAQDAAEPFPATGMTFFGVSLNSDYVLYSVSQNHERPALQAYVEHNWANGLYAGLWTSQMDYSEFGLDDNFEIDAYIGYRGGFQKVSYDLSYYRYYYDHTGFDYDEFIGIVDYHVTDAFLVGGKLRLAQGGTYDDEQVYGVHASYDLTPKTTLSYEWMTNSADANNDWNIGVRQQLTDSLSIKATYYDSNFSKDILGVSLSWDTDFASLFGPKS